MKAFLPPAGACDSHAHVFGPESSYPYATPRSYTPADASLDEYISVLDSLNIERCVLVQPSVYGTDNRLLLDSLEKLGSRARGVAVIDEDVSKSELEQMHELGIRGIRFNFLFEGCIPALKIENGKKSLDAGRLLSIISKVEPLGWHVQILMNVDDLPDLAAVLAQIETTVVIDHMGHMDTAAGTGAPGFTCLTEELQKRDWWVKLSAPYRFSCSQSPFEDVAPFARELVRVAPDRMVWATDWPHPHPKVKPPAPAELLSLLVAWAGNTGLAGKILVENPERLYGFGRKVC